MVYYRWKNIEDVAASQRSNPRYDQGEYHLDELEAKQLNERYLALFTPHKINGRCRRIVGWFDFSAHLNELHDGIQPTDLVSQGYRSVYHPPAPLFCSPLDDPTDYFDIFPRSRYTNGFCNLLRSNWGQTDNAYQTPPAWRESNNKHRDPSDVHNDQTGLNAFNNADTDTSTDDEAEHDDRLDGLPVYLPDDEIPNTHVNDPNRSGPNRCNRCGAHMPWDEPLERGVRSIRDGNIKDGDPNYDHCDPSIVDVRSCSCCGCPKCAAKSTRHRKSKSPPWACNNPKCGIKFSHPIERPPGIRDNHDSQKRERLYWKCRECGEATQAPFTGIPEEMLRKSGDD